jgi:hypothetical protein
MGCCASDDDDDDNCGNTAVDLDPLPVNRARLTVIELPLFE